MGVFFLAHFWLMVIFRGQEDESVVGPSMWSFQTWLCDPDNKFLKLRYARRRDISSRGRILLVGGAACSDIVNSSVSGGVSVKGGVKCVGHIGCIDGCLVCHGI